MRKLDKSCATSKPSEYVLSQVVWYYHVANLTQQEISMKLDLSRPTIMKYLQAAKDQGLFRIVVDEKVFHQEQLSDQICQKYNLNKVHVVPVVKGDKDNFKYFTKSAGQILNILLNENDKVAFSWGMTLFNMSKAMDPIESKNIELVQMVGGMRNIPFNIDMCSITFSKKLGAHLNYWYAPLITSNPEVKKMLDQDSSIIEQRELISSCNKAIFSVGNIDHSTFIVLAGLEGDEWLEEIRKRGAVAVMCGYFVDKNGNHVPSKYDDCLMATPLEKIKEIEEKILFAAGTHKFESTLALLNGGFVSDLVVDKDLGNLLVNA